MDERQRIRKKRQRIRKIRRIKRLIRRTVIGLALLLVILVIFFACSKGRNKEKELQDEKTKQEEQEELVIETEPEIEIVMVGDMLLHTAVQESGKMSDGTYNYDHMFTHVTDDVQKADIAIANQEVILGGTEIGLYGYPNFNGPYEVGDALVKAGFNVILHATNHTLDRGKTALVNCMNFWKTNYSQVAVLGIFESQKAYDNDIYVYEEEGIKIAILNYTYGTNGMPTPADMPFAVAMLEKDKVVSDIQKANTIADFVVVCPHWGTEYQHIPSEEQEDWTDIFLENGVDLVLGTHPHYIQPVEMLTNDNGDEMLVYYSLGNFINATSGSGAGTADRMIGAMAEITVSRDENGEVYIKEYGVEPLVTQLLYGAQEITTYKLSDYTQELASRNKVIEKDSAFSLEYCDNLCREVFGDLYKGREHINEQ